MSSSQDPFMEQATSTADTYMHEAIARIDKAFGEGYAKEHPELVGAFMQTAALDFQAAMIRRFA